MNYKIVADSSSNVFGLSGVDYAHVPLKILNQGVEYVDVPGLDVFGMLDAMKASREGSSTSCPNVYEWKETDKFLYGSGRGERYFVYDKEKDEMTFFSSEHDFWTTAKSLGLKYGEGVCDTVEGYFYKNY